MLVHKSGRLLLNLREPERVTDVIPTAQALDAGGATVVVVPHREDEVRVLRNLGFDAPAPIEARYKWPCAYPKGPFKHQRITSAFMTLNPRAYILNGMGCIAGDEKVRVSRKLESYETDLRTLHRKFHALPDPDTWRVRSLKDGQFGMNQLLDVLYKGEQPTLHITLADGKEFRCTADHRVARPGGTWTEAGALRVGDDLITNGTQAYACSECGRLRPRRAPPRTATQVCRACKWRRQSARMDGARSGRGGIVVVLPKTSAIVSIEDGGVTDVYDLCMAAPHHNFVVNGVVVHNSGKSLAALWAFDHLRTCGLATRLLIVAPLSTLARTWGDEIFTHLPHLEFAVLHGAMDRRLKLLNLKRDVYIVNHDGIKSKLLLAALAARPDIDVVVLDELAVFRTAGTDRFKSAAKLVEGRKYVWGMTGTPIPNGPTDAWAQCRLVTPHSVPRNFSQFREATMRQVSTYKWVARDTALGTVRNAMQPAVRFSREECIDLPPTTYVTREAPLAPEQKRAYDTMLRELVAEYNGGRVLAVNEAVKLGKLLQIGCGVAYGKDGQEVVIPSQPRVDLVREIIEEAEAKVIVFVPFTAALLRLAEHLRKDFSVECVYGEVSKNERDRIFGEFQKRPDPRVLVADARTMSHGLNLTAANTIVWYGPTPSNDTYLQANERIPRPGQKLNTLIVHIVSTPAEAKIYDRLRKKTSVQGALLELLKEAR